MAQIVAHNDFFKDINMKSLKLMEQVIQDRLHNEISSINYELQNSDYEGMVF